VPDAFVLTCELTPLDTVCFTKTELLIPSSPFKSAGAPRLCALYLKPIELPSPLIDGDVELPSAGNPEALLEISLKLCVSKV
jgi:hypothetical protein